MIINQGDVTTGIMARNTTQGSETGVGYSFDIQYYIGNTSYLAQIMLNTVSLSIAGQVITMPLKTCAGFEMTNSSVTYDGAIPTLDCNITFRGIRVYQDAHPSSTLDLTLVHHFRGDWNQTDIKVEALFDFTNTRLYQPNGTEYNTGESFTAEIHYLMQLSNPETLSQSGPIVPVGHTNNTLEYNLTLDNGSPLTVSKLEMKDSFTIFNESGARLSMGYSSMIYGGQSQVTHGFPGLSYKGTQTVRSDPEITVFHNRVTVNPASQPGNPTDSPPIFLIVVALAGVIGAFTIAALIMKKKKGKR